jgi:hypothetical protein
MSSTLENRKLKNGNVEQSNSGVSKAPEPASATLKKAQGNSNNTREEGPTKTKKKRRTKVGLNDTLRRIRHLIIEGRSNLEIQNILQLEERTFYRYMAKIHEIDQALFAEQQKKTLATGLSIFKDRLLKAYRWYIAMAENENIKAAIRMEARLDAIGVAHTLLLSEREGSRVIEEGRLLETLHENHKVKY